MDKTFEHAEWVWLPGGETVNQYADLLHEFCLPTQFHTVQLHICADSRYTAYMNGSHLAAFHFHDYPMTKVFDTVDVTAAVHAGKNLLAVVGYFQGEDSSVYRTGRAGVLFSVVADGVTVAESGSGTMCRLSKAYGSGEMERFSGQLSFSFRYDARRDDGWHEADYVPDHGWVCAASRKNEADLCPRTIEQAEYLPPRAARLVAQGTFADKLGADAPCGDRMQSAALTACHPWDWKLSACPPELPDEQGLELASSDGDGLYVVIDLGREEAGLLHLDIEMPEPAEILIGFGEHMDDLRVRTSVGGRQFAAVYKAKAGRQSFTHWMKHVGCRYVQLHVYAPKAKLFYAGVIPSRYPVKYRPVFHCADELHNRIFEVSRRTLELCMHEHYEDCPWREQALYAMDSRNQMLCGYYVFDGFAFAQASLRLLALGLRDDGLLELCAPAKVGITIPAFSLSFITGVCENVQFSKDKAFAAEMLPTVEKILDTFLGRIEPNGLVACFTEPAYWNFYEWADGLDGCPIFRTESIPKTYDAPLNGMLSLALSDAAALYDFVGNAAKAEALLSQKEALNRSMGAFWSPQHGAFATYLSADGLSHYCQLSQALTVCAGAAAGSRKEQALQSLKSNEKLVPTTLSCTIFKYQALMQEPENYAGWVRQDIAKIWGGMLFQGATSFWETEAGAWDFHHAGSLCHGWSSIPIYFYYRYVLGIRPGDPQPHPIPCGLYEAGLQAVKESR